MGAFCNYSECFVQVVPISISIEKVLYRLLRFMSGFRYQLMKENYWVLNDQNMWPNIIMVLLLTILSKCMQVVPFLVLLERCPSWY